MINITKTIDWMKVSAKLTRTNWLVGLLAVCFSLIAGCKQTEKESPTPKDVRDPFVGTYSVTDSLFYLQEIDSLGRYVWQLQMVRTFPKVSLSKATVYDFDWKRNEPGMRYEIIEYGMDSSSGSSPYGMSYNMDFLVYSSTAKVELINTNNTKFSSIRGAFVRGELFFIGTEDFSSYSSAHFRRIP